MLGLDHGTPMAVTRADPDRRERADARAVAAWPEAGVCVRCRREVCPLCVEPEGPRHAPDHRAVLRLRRLRATLEPEREPARVHPRSRRRVPGPLPRRRGRDRPPSADQHRSHGVLHGLERERRARLIAAAPPFRLFALDLATGEEKSLRTWPSAPLHEAFDGARDASLWHEISDPGSTIGTVAGRLVVPIAGSATPGSGSSTKSPHTGARSARCPATSTSRSTTSSSRGPSTAVISPR